MIHWLHKNWVCDVMVCQSYSVYLTLVQKKRKNSMLLLLNTIYPIYVVT